MDPDDVGMRLARLSEPHSCILDYIVFADVLEHLPDPAEIVEMAKGGLKTGGSVVASISNMAH